MNYAIRIALLLAVAAHVALRLNDVSRAADTLDILPPPSFGHLRAASLGDPIPLAQIAALLFQSTDRGPGPSRPFAYLDYERVENWLSAILQMDPASDYALMLATHVYAQAADSSKQRRKLDFVHRAYQFDPARRWRWLAHASLMARHRLNDLDLARDYANALSAAGVDAGVPIWALQLRALLDEERGEYESARIYVGGLLASGRVADEGEARFLASEVDRLAAFATRSASSAK